MTSTSPDPRVAELIAMCDERKELMPLDDGYIHYWPTVGGAIAPWQLRAIADEIDHRNVDWDRQVQSDPRIGGAVSEAAAEQPLPEILQLPGVSPRVETGPIVFGDDWPGTFIRGDNAGHYAMHLREALRHGQVNPISAAVLIGLASDLESSNLALRHGK